MCSFELTAEEIIPGPVFFQLVYRAAGNELKTKYTTVLDTPDFIRAKTGQKIQSQVKKIVLI